MAGEHRCHSAETALAPALQQTVQENLSVGKLKPGSGQGAAVRSIREGIEKEPAMPGGRRLQERGGGVAGVHNGVKRDRTRCSGFGLKEGQIRLNIRSEVFYIGDGKILAQAAQRGGECPIPGRPG